MPEESLRILLHAHLRHYNEGREETSLPFRAGATVAEYLAVLDIPGHEFAGVVLDGELTGDVTLVPQRDSVLELVPAMSGG